MSSTLKTIICGAFMMLLLSFSLPVHSQYIATLDGEKIEIRDIKGSYVTSGYYPGVKDVAQADSFLILSYDSGKIEVRDYNLGYLTSMYMSGLQQISATQDWVVIYYESGKIEVRDKELKYYSSWFHS
jgi:hypothetical protein